MRQIATSRYSFGFWGAKLCSVLNIVVGGGFAVVNYVVVGQILSAVSGYTMSITVGIVIIAVISYVVSIFGFRLIHTFEKYSWIYTLSSSAFSSVRRRLTYKLISPAEMVTQGWYIQERFSPSLQSTFVSL